MEMWDTEGGIYLHEEYSLSNYLYNNFVRIFLPVTRNLWNTSDFQAVSSEVLFKSVKWFFLKILTGLL